MNTIIDIRDSLKKFSDNSIFTPDFNALDVNDWLKIIEILKIDYGRYYEGDLEINNIKYYPGLLSTFFYRISRFLYLKGDEYNAREYSSMGFDLTGIELYYSAEIGKGLKINHGIGTVVGSRTQLGDNVLLHHSITIGEKNGGRARIGNNVIIYPGAIIVGAIIIGNHSVVGANVFVDKSYPEKSIIF